VKSGINAVPLETDGGSVLQAGNGAVRGTRTARGLLQRDTMRDVCSVVALEANSRTTQWGRSVRGAVREAL